MVIKYNDPYGNRKHAQLKGDKRDSYFKLVFSEATVHKTDEGYILFGQIDEYQGVVRSFKPENPITPGLCIVPFYNQEYEVRKKGTDGNWTSEKMQPSIFEKIFCDRIQKFESEWSAYNVSIKGHVTHVPDPMLEGQDKTAREDFVCNNVLMEQIDSTGKLPDYTPSVSGGQRKSYGGYKGVSMEDKLAFIHKQMEEDIKDLTFKKGQCLADLTDQMIKEHSDNPNFLEIYFDILLACVK